MTFLLLFLCACEPADAPDSAAPPDSGGDTDSGAADSGDPADTGIAPAFAGAPDWSAHGDGDLAWFGFSVAGAGDVDADGYDDIVIGARNTFGDFPNAGSAHLYRGSPDGPEAEAAWSIAGASNEARCGEAVGGAGDVNADGYDDVIVGIGNHETSSGGNGQALLFLGSPEGLETTTRWRFDSQQADSWLGRSVAGAGDIDGDGFHDVLIGEKYYNDPEPAAGRVLLFRGGELGLSRSPDWVLTGGQRGAFLGFSVHTAGDINGDGLSDVIVGASMYDQAATDDGIAWVFHGDAAGLGGTPDWSADPGPERGGCGYPVAPAGDVNADGHADVILGCMDATVSLGGEGMARVYLGGPDGLGGIAWQVYGTQEQEEFGYAVTGTGDADGDGFDDVVVAARSHTADHPGEGAAWLFPGSSAGPREDASWNVAGGLADAGIGWSAAHAGDVDADGRGDVLLGLASADVLDNEDGAVWLFLGGGR